MKIVIIDDHLLIGHTLMLCLNDKYGTDIHPFVPENFDYGILVDCDLLLLDFDFEDLGDANLVLRRIDNLGMNKLKIILFSSLWKAPVLMTCRHPFIKGYVAKKKDFSNFLTAIDEVIAGGTWYQPEYAEEIKRLIALPKGEVLSPRENEIAHLVRQRYSREEIATELNISIHTVANHYKSIFQKLGIKSEREI